MNSCTVSSCEEACATEKLFVRSPVKNFTYGEARIEDVVKAAAFCEQQEDGAAATTSEDHALLDRYTDCVLMVRPSCFGYDPNCAADNEFMNQVDASTQHITAVAQQEFDAFVNLLRENHVNVKVVQDVSSGGEGGRFTPDSIFPNNVVSVVSVPAANATTTRPLATPVKKPSFAESQSSLASTQASFCSDLSTSDGPSGTGAAADAGACAPAQILVTLFPMKSPNRRLERENGIVDVILATLQQTAAPALPSTLGVASGGLGRPNSPSTSASLDSDHHRLYEPTAYSDKPPPPGEEVATVSYERAFAAPPRQKVSLDRSLLGGELRGEFLEGTGSMVLDRSAGVVYAALSQRTHQPTAQRWAEKHGFQHTVFFRTTITVYHTNVVLALCNGFSILCEDVVSPEDLPHLRYALTHLSGCRDIIAISQDQVNHFVGNALGLRVPAPAGRWQSLCVMSQTAASALTDHQRHLIERKHAHKIVAPSIPMIETIGGGSARCMLLEIFSGSTDGAGRHTCTLGDREAL